MRSWIAAPLGLFALLVWLPGAAAEATITAAAPTEALPWDGSATVDVSVKASCATLLQDNQAGVTELELSGASEVPWIIISGQKVPWTEDQCDTSTASQASSCTPQPACAADYPVATTRGALTLAPRNDAPALTQATITVTARGETGSTSFTAFVAYHGSLNGTVPKPMVEVAPEEEVRFILELEALTNGKSMVMFSVKEGPARGKVSGLPELVDVEPKVSYIMDHGGMMMWMDVAGAGEPELVTLPLTFLAPPQPFVPETFTVEAMLMSYDDPALASEPVTLSWTFEPVEAATPAGDESAPGPPVGALALGLLVVLAWRRRPRAT